MLAQRHSPLQLFAISLVSVCLAGAAGCTSTQGEFTSGLVLDSCNSDIPACNGVVGCILSDTSYTGGIFPGSGQFLIQTPGPATVEIAFFLSNPTADGTETFMTWYESGCTSSFQQSVPGNVFIGEAESNNGTFSRTQMLSSPGDHLITFQSDATANYLVKVLITPTDSSGT